jgi:dihydroorotate dehydrogenase electron transfer subunit
MRRDVQARIISKENWGDYFLISLESPDIASHAKPGQFIMVRIDPQPYPLLRRPFSIHSRDGATIQIFFQITGAGTSLLSQKKQNDFLDLLGPLGKGFTEGSQLQGKEPVAIGGGRGIAPLFFLAQELRIHNSSLKIFYGGKTIQDLPLKERFERESFELFCSTDDGSFGYKGLVSDYFKDEINKINPGHLFACGPEPMMEKIAQTAKKKNIPAEFSLESVMGCGFGACWGCVKKIKKENKAEWIKICENGPVFRSEEIVWEDREK